MEVNKALDINEAYELLQRAITNLPKDDQLKLTRFIDKLSDSDKFANKVNQIFNQKKLNLVYQTQSSRDSLATYHMGNGLKFQWNGNSYDLYYYDELFLDNLDKKLAKKITKDINVAVLIKLSRCQSEI